MVRDDRQVTVEHEPEAQRFVVRLRDGERLQIAHLQNLAVLGYAQPRRDLLDLQHTFVPESARGLGVGDALVEAALRHAQASGMRIIPTCPFVRSWVERHREHDALVMKEY